MQSDVQGRGTEFLPRRRRRFAQETGQYTRAEKFRLERGHRFRRSGSRPAGTALPGFIQPDRSYIQHIFVRSDPELDRAGRFEPGGTFADACRRNGIFATGIARIGSVADLSIGIASADA